MGKQINYYMGYDDFREVARKALGLGCLILKNENGEQFFKIQPLQ